MQINRLLGIVFFLLNKGGATAGELAARFEVSQRTILRDVDTLSAAGIPVYTLQGKGGGVALMENFVIDRAAVSDEEQDEILFALQSLTAAGQADYTQILTKLRALFDKAETDWIEVDFSRWGHGKTDKPRFEILKRAIIKRQAVQIIYAGSYGETASRKVYPLKLVFKSKAWYLQAWCPQKEDYRTFKNSRMLSVEPLPESFEGESFEPPPIELDAPVSAQMINLKLRFAPCLAYRVFDEFDMSEVTRSPDGSFGVEVNLPEDAWLYGFLLSCGVYVQVLEPQSVKERLLAEIEKLRKFYADDII
ncbi:MAG: YafY family transcriptional regulator [Clostridiales bacterium]|jgi:predicted DNA-binding transcriptional regulator YafY|nr:YafY family transcriptional regulator [Clostridiales bacterium]